MHDLKFCGGRVYDPLTNTFQVRDVAVDGAVMAQDPSGDARLTVDASGCIVTPGLIDYHIHLFSAIPSGSIRADLACLPYGVTTAVDGGTSGAPTYPIFHELEVRRAQVRLLAYLNIGSSGLTSTVSMEDPTPEHIERDLIREMFRRYPGELVALKLRNSLGIVQPGDEGPVRAMVELGEELGVPVVAHMTNPAVACEKVAQILRPGDVFCHMYQGQGDTILGPDGKVKPEIWEARRRGVLFDACNGNANFSFRVAEPAMEQGFLPDLIGSDLTPMSFHRPFVHDLPRLLSKYLMLGMKLEDVLQRVTLAPARQLGRVEELATLHAGTPADVALFRLAEQPVTFRDRDGESRTGSQVLLPQMTVKDGAIAWAQTGFN